MLREDVDCGGVVSTVRQVQGAELGHQVHETASHALLVLREPTDANTPATMFSLLIRTLQLRYPQVRAQEPPAAQGHSQVTQAKHPHLPLGEEEEEEEGGPVLGLGFCGADSEHHNPLSAWDRQGVPSMSCPTADPQLGCCGKRWVQRRGGPTVWAAHEYERGGGERQGSHSLNIFPIFSLFPTSFHPFQRRGWPKAERVLLEDLPQGNHHL